MAQKAAIALCTIALMAIVFMHNPTSGYITEEHSNPTLDYYFDSEWRADLSQCGAEVRDRWEKNKQKMASLLTEKWPEVRESKDLLAQMNALREATNSIAKQCLNSRMVYMPAKAKPFLEWVSVGALVPWFSVISNAIWAATCIAVAALVLLIVLRPSRSDYAIEAKD